jgi:uncharacterized Zn-finger protein
MKTKINGLYFTVCPHCKKAYLYDKNDIYCDEDKNEKIECPHCKTLFFLSSLPHKKETLNHYISRIQTHAVHHSFDQVYKSICQKHWNKIKEMWLIGGESEDLQWILADIILEALKTLPDYTEV